jgi:hypothetical protein
MALHSSINKAMNINTVYFILLGMILLIMGDYVAKSTAFLCLMYGAYRLCGETFVKPNPTPYQSVPAHRKQFSTGPLSPKSDPNHTAYREQSLEETLD